jgi:hypothetical protein
MAFGASPAFFVPAALDALWPSLQDEHFRVPALVSWAVTVLNPPALF